MSRIEIDLSNCANDVLVRHSPFFVNGFSNSGFPTPAHLKMLKLSKCKIYGCDIYNVITNANSGASETDNEVEVSLENVNITSEDSYSGFFSNVAYTNNILKLETNLKNEVTRKELRGAYTFYDYKGSESRINLKYIISGTEYFVNNSSGAALDIGFGGPLVRFNSADTYVVQIPSGAILKCYYDNKSELIFAEILERGEMTDKRAWYQELNEIEYKVKANPY